jgi:hypothetical protein
MEMIMDWEERDFGSFFSGGTNEYRKSKIYSE